MMGRDQLFPSPEAVFRKALYQEEEGFGFSKLSYNYYNSIIKLISLMFKETYEVLFTNFW